MEKDVGQNNVSAQLKMTPPSTTSNRREADENRCLLAGALKQVGLGDVRQIIRQLEISMRGRAARMHDPLWDALVAKVEYFLAEDKIL